MGEKRHLLKFIENSQAFDNNSKLKALLFVIGIKPNTYIHLRVQKNLHDKHEFERLLRLNKIFFNAGRAKGFEEISGIRGNAVVWKMKGTWYGYDLFKDKKDKKRFEKYVSLIKKQKHARADLLAGKLYGYPSCCVKNFIEENSPEKLAKKYAKYQFYKRLHEFDRKFPFITHTPCSLSCKKTMALNKKYSTAIKKWAPKFYREYSRKRKCHLPVIVDLDSDSVPWKKKDGHEYSLITKKPIEGKYYLISWLTKPAFKRGTILNSEITLQYDFALVVVKKKIGSIENLHHERKFTRV